VQITFKYRFRLICAFVWLKNRLERCSVKIVVGSVDRAGHLLEVPRMCDETEENVDGKLGGACALAVGELERLYVRWKRF